MERKDIEQAMQKAREMAVEFTWRMRAIHDRHWPDCPGWETWRDEYGDTWDGCQTHHMAVQL